VSPDPTSIGQLVHVAKEVADEDLSQPIFIDLDVGVVLSEIQSCTEGGPAVTPPPKPVPTPEPPPTFDKYVVQLSEITAVTRGAASPQTNPEPGAASRPYFRPMASISGKGEIVGSRHFLQTKGSINIQLDDTPANAVCLDLARRQMLSTAAIQNRGLEIVGTGWDLAVPMMGCALNNCPNFINIHLNEILSCKPTH